MKSPNISCLVGLKSDVQLFYFSFRKRRSWRQLHSPDGSGFEPKTSGFLVERNYHEANSFRANNSLAAETKSGLSFLLFLSSLKFPGRNKNNFFFVTWAWISNCPVSSSWSLHLTYTLSLSLSPLFALSTLSLHSFSSLSSTHPRYEAFTHFLPHSHTHGDPFTQFLPRAHTRWTIHAHTSTTLSCMYTHSPTRPFSTHTFGETDTNSCRRSPAEFIAVAVKWMQNRSFKKWRRTWGGSSRIGKTSFTFSLSKR